MIWGGDEMFETNTNNMLKRTFQFECKEIEAFACIGIGLVQDSDLASVLIKTIIQAHSQKQYHQQTKQKIKTVFYPMKKRSCTEVQSVN